MAKKRREFAFQFVRSVGWVLPPEILQRVAELDSRLPGLNPTDYGLAESERLGEAITRSWTRLLDIHRAFADAIPDTDTSDTSAAPTLKLWLRHVFQEMGYGTLTPTPQARMVDEAAYAISHQWNKVPLHLVGANVPLDRRTSGVTGASRSAPHSLVQEYLNRTDEYLWAMVSNGRLLRLVRDNVSMTRPGFVEFDLDGMFKAQSFADFRLLWLVLHATRYAVPADGQPHQCIAEQWHVEGATTGTRVLGELSKGVREAIEALGRGFLAHPSNKALRDALSSGELDKQEYYRQLLRLVYRLLFLFVSESRDLLLDPHASRKARETYRKFYSTARLQELAGSLRGNRHPDLYETLKRVMKGLGGPTGFPEIGVIPLGGYLWAESSIGLLAQSALANQALLAAVRSLSFIVDKNGRRPVDYRNLGTEELGGVYEQLLELHPEINPTAPNLDKRFVLEVSAGNERKTSGSHYTPDSLVQVCLDTALEPLLAERLAGKKGPEAEKTILALKVVDTAVGSGHFLIGAAHRMAKRLAAVRTGDTEPSPEAYRAALRDVIRSCLYGVDLNPMAAELCRVALWLESMEPGKPLSFLDHHIKVGNSLLGATPALMAKGIPDEAFEPIEGDDKKLCAQYRKANKREREDAQNKQMGLFAQPIKLGNLPSVYATMAALPDDSLAAVEEKRRQYQDLVKSADYLSGRLLADSWCAAFVWKKTGEFDYPVTEEVFRALEENPRSQPAWMVEEIQRLAGQYHFFHWHLEFPDVFRVPAANEKPENEQTGWSGGFDCVLGNPPWERLRADAAEFLELFDARIGSLSSAARKSQIESLRDSEPELVRTWEEYRRATEAASSFVRSAGLYPLTARSKFNTAGLFSELALLLMQPSAHAATVVPTGVVTDEAAKEFTSSLINAERLRYVYDFINTEGLFPDVDSRYRFCVLAWNGTATPPCTIRAGFLLSTVEDLRTPGSLYELSAKDVAAINPNTRNCPAMSGTVQFGIVRLIHARWPVLDHEDREENEWGFHPTFMFQVTDNAGNYVAFSQLNAKTLQVAGHRIPAGSQAVIYTSLYEGKQIHQFDHRFAGCFAGEQTDAADDVLPLTTQHKYDPTALSRSRFWISESDFLAKRAARPIGANWFLTYREVTNSGNERTLIACVTPFTAASRKAPQIYLTCSPHKSLIFLGAVNAVVCDYVARSKLTSPSIGNYFFRQIPLPGPSAVFPKGLPEALLVAHVVELTYTAWDLEAFGVDCGYGGPPFRWDEDRRFLLRAELDAAFFHLYLGTPDEWERDASPALKAKLPTPRHAVDHIMETFPIVKRKDIEAHGTYRTKDTILSIYDEMAGAIRTGQPYRTRLDPPPADPSCRHPESTRPSWAVPQS